MLYHKNTELQMVSKYATLYCKLQDIRLLCCLKILEVTSKKIEFIINNQK